MIHAAVDRFYAAGLTLPAVHIQAPDPSTCTAAGMAHNKWLVDAIDICELSERDVIHELAHTWTYRHINRTEREVWMERR